MKNEVFVWDPYTPFMRWPLRIWGVLLILLVPYCLFKKEYVPALLNAVFAWYLFSLTQRESIRRSIRGAELFRRRLFCGLVGLMVLLMLILVAITLRIGW